MGYAVLLTLQRNASDKILASIRQIKPEQEIEDVRKQLGKEMYEIKETGGIILHGSLKDPEFCADKILYWFYISTPPSRVVEVYTDQNGKVKFVTWQGL